MEVSRMGDSKEVLGDRKEALGEALGEVLLGLGLGGMKREATYPRQKANCSWGKRQGTGYTRGIQDISCGDTNLMGIQISCDTGTVER